MARLHNALTHGQPLSPHAYVRSGWLELTASIPDAVLPALDDLSALHLNAHLGGSLRVARACGSSRPHLRRDVWTEHVEDLAEWTRSTGAAFADVVHQVARAREHAVAQPSESPLTIADVERACAEAGWRAVVNDASLRVEIGTRHGVYGARFESSPSAGQRFVVDLVELSGCPEVSRRAAAALLMAVSGSVRLVKGAIGDRGAALIAASAVASRPVVDEQLSALSVACEIAGREVQALMDERLASEYLALSYGTSREDTRAVMEEQTCLQQQ